jgi:hypothetical protein
MKNKGYIVSVITMIVALLGCSNAGSDDPDEKPSVTITCSTNELSFDNKAGIATVDISVTNEWTIYSTADWISCSPSSSINTKETVTVSVEKNSEASSRTAALIVKSGKARDTITVVQAGDVSDDIVTPDGYSLVWHDEFDDARVAGGKPAMPGSDWTYQVANPGFVNSELQYYVSGITSSGDTLAYITDGTLKIKTAKINGNVYSIRMYGKQSTGWKYGYIEARMKLPTGKGTWPAFWMMPVNFTAWPDDGEMDIMEEVGYNPNVIVSSLHAKNHYGGNPKSGSINCATSQTEFHKYAMEWTSSSITFFLDDKAFYTYNNPGTGTDDWPYNSSFYVILNMAWGGSWGGQQGVDESYLPTTYEIDYVRVFQKN